MISSGGRHRQLIETLRAGLAEKRAVLDRTVADYQESARAVVARLQAQDQTQRDETQQDQRARQNREHHDAGDYDAVDSWMSNQWRDAPAGPPEPEDTRPSPHDAVLDRIDRGELTWGDVLSGRASDPQAAAVRSFLSDRAAEFRRVREARA
jgi:hypothetical protein